MATSKVRAAACHTSAIFLDAARTTEKAISLIHQAAKNGANIVVFPETYIPAFPVWSALQAPHQNHHFFQQMVKESLYVDGKEIKSIREATKEAGVIVSLGISEKSRDSNATLYNSNILIGSNGDVLVHHRKLMPTFFEKLTWSPGDGQGLEVIDTAFGKIGALICGENTNPLARYTMIAQSEQIHISTFPAKWPTRVDSNPSVRPVSRPENPNAEDNKHSKKGSSQIKGGNYVNVAANRIRGAAHCFEGKCFGIISAGFLDEYCRDSIANGCVDSSTIKAQLDQTPQAASMFLDPTGALLPGFVIDPQSGAQIAKDYLQHEPDILYADMDLEECVEGKQYHDITGGYQRLDVFDLKVDRSRRNPVTFSSS